jgi:hypothetical protein
VDQHAVAAINIYGREPHAFAQPEAKALRFGTWAASALTDREPCEILNSE